MAKKTSKLHEIVKVGGGKIVHTYEPVGEGGGGTSDPSYSEDVVLSSDLTFNNSVGGIDSGSKFIAGTSIDTIIRKMANKMVLPKVTLRSNLSTLIYEQGYTIPAGTKFTASVTVGSSKITRVEFYKNESKVHSITSGIEAGGSFSYQDSSSISSDTDYTVSVMNEEGKIVSAGLSIKFYSSYYYGVSDKQLSDISDSDILALSKDISSKSTKKYSYTSNNQYCVVAYPKKYGLLKSVLDPSNFENIDSMECKELSINSVLYYVYATQTPVTCSGFIYTFVY